MDFLFLSSKIRGGYIFARVTLTRGTYSTKVDSQGLLLGQGFVPHHSREAALSILHGSMRSMDDFLYWDENSGDRWLGLGLGFPSLLLEVRSLQD